jgi:hypothetical protein
MKNFRKTFNSQLVDLKNCVEIFSLGMFNCLSERLDSNLFFQQPKCPVLFIISEKGIFLNMTLLLIVLTLFYKDLPKLLLPLKYPIVLI